MLGVELWSAQVSILEAIRDNRNTTVRSGHKALANDTPVWTPKGWRRHGDLVPGDVVFAPDGSQTRVTDVFPFEPRTMFRLTFEDGSHIDADADHEWVVHSRESRKRTFKSAQRRTTAQLLEKVDVPNGKTRVANWTIDLTAPLDGDSGALPLDPYLLGLWLGDGHSDGGGFTSADGLEDAFRAGGFDVAERKPIQFYARGLCTLLRKAGVLGDKHVPDAYLHSSRQDRMALLQGLLDSDGYAGARGRVEFMNTNRRLADAVLFLAHSLGIKARIAEKRATLYGKDCGPCWRVTWSSPAQVFRLARKAAGIRTTWEHKASAHRRMAIVSIRALPEKQACQCIRVAHASHMYLAGLSLIPTSNCGKSTALAVAGLWFYCSFSRARVVMTAVKASQIDEVIWKEVRRLYREAKIPIGGELYSLARSGLRDLVDDRQIWGITARDGEGLAGISGPNVLVLTDEASGIPDRFFEVLGSSLAGSGGTARKCYISNPTRTTGEFYRSHTTNAHMFKCLHVSSTDTPNARGTGVIPGLAGKDWIEEKRVEYGEDSAAYKVRVLGEFVHDKDGKIISLDLIAAAEAAWDDTPETGDLQIGIDPAGDGILGDETAMAVRRGGKIVTVLAWRGQTEDAIVAHAIGLLEEHRQRGVVGIPRIAVDVEGGIGTRVMAKLRVVAESGSMGVELVEVRGGKKLWGSPDYDMIRDALWGQACEWIKAGGALPSDVKLSQDLNAPTFVADKNRRYVATSKKDLRKLLGRSPDKGDAVCLAIWGYASVDASAPRDTGAGVAATMADLYGAPAGGDAYSLDVGGGNDPVYG